MFYLDRKHLLSKTNIVRSRSVCLPQDFPWGDVTRTYSTPDKDPTTDQSMGTTQFQFGEPVRFIGFMGAEMTKLQHG